MKKCRGLLVLLREAEPAKILQKSRIKKKDK